MSLLILIALICLAVSALFWALVALCMSRKNPLISLGISGASIIVSIIVIIVSIILTVISIVKIINKFM